MKIFNKDCPECDSTLEERALTTEIKLTCTKCGYVIRKEYT